VTGRAFLVVALVWVALVGLAVAIAGGGLGNDEAQYALGARQLFGDPGDPYPLFRSIGMRVLAAPGVLAGGGELAIRIPFVLVAIAYAALVWRLARRLGGEQAAMLALAVQVSSAPWLTRTGEALSDIASAGLLLALVELVAGDLARPQARARAWVGVAAAGAAAFYVRYGSAPLVALLIAAVVIAFPTRRRAALAAAAGIAIAVLPFFVWSASRTGSVLGVLRVSETAANREYVGDGLLWYLSRWPSEVAWPAMAAAAAVGIVIGLRRPGIPRVLAVAAIAQIVLLGLRVHGESRYVFFAMSALTVVGAAWIAERPRLRTGMLALCALSAVLGAGFAIARADRMAHRRAAMVTAAAAVRADARGARCLVYTGTQPQVAWYTRCRTHLIGQGEAPFDAARGYPRVYLLSAEGSPRQPESGAAASTPALEFMPLVSGHDPDWFVWRAR